MALHDSFGQSGDEYKLPTPGNIPDATTDPSQIRVLPVIDPTAKTEKGSDANGGRAQATTGESTATDQKPTDQNHLDQTQAGQGQSGQAQAGNDQVKEQIKDPSATSIGAVPESAAGTSPGVALPSVPVQPNAPGSPDGRAAAASGHVYGAECYTAACRFDGKQHRHSVESEIADGFDDPGCQREQAGRGSDVGD